MGEKKKRISGHSENDKIIVNTYHSTYVEKVICKHDASVYGFHLHIGDNEEYADAYLLSEGKYKVTINR